MSTKIIGPHYYRVSKQDYAALDYSRDGEQKLGGYTNRTHTQWEAVSKIDPSLLSSPVTIDSVTIDVNIIANVNASTTAYQLDVREQDGGSWVDNPGVEPDGDTPSFFDTHGEYTNILSTVTIPDGNPTGIFTIPSSSNLVQLMQDYVDGTKDWNNGFIITQYTDYYNYYITTDSITWTIEYTGGSTGPKHRVMIIS